MWTTHVQSPCVSPFNSKMLHSNCNQPWFVKGIVEPRYHCCDFFFTASTTANDALMRFQVKLSTLGMTLHWCKGWMLVVLSCYIWWNLNNFVELLPTFSKWQCRRCILKGHDSLSVRFENSKHIISCYTYYNFKWPLFSVLQHGAQRQFLKNQEWSPRHGAVSTLIVSCGIYFISQEILC